MFGKSTKEVQCVKMSGKIESAYNIVLRIISKVFGYMILLVFANLFALDAYGKASFILAVFSIISVFIFFGLPDGFIPFLIKNKRVSEIFYFLLFINVLIVITGIFISLKFLTIILPLTLSLPFILFFRIQIAILRSRHKYHLVQLVYLGIVVLPLLFTLLLIKFGAFGIITAYSIGYILTSIITFFFVKKDVIKIILHPRFTFKIGFYIKQAIPVSVIGFSFLVLGWIDSSILGFLSTYENVAKYNIASPLANVITVIALAIAMFLLTRSAELKNKKKSLAVLNRSARISFSFSLVSAIVLSALVFLITRIFFPKYVGIEVFVAILTMGIVFYSVYVLFYTYLTGKQRAEKALMPLLTAMAVNIILDILLIPKFGLYGITIATTIAHLTALLLLIKVVKLNRYYWSLPLVLLIPVSFYLGYFGIIIAIASVPLLFMTRMIEKQDINIVLNTLKTIVK